MAICENVEIELFFQMSLSLEDKNKLFHPEA